MFYDMHNHGQAVKLADDLTMALSHHASGLITDLELLERVIKLAKPLAPKKPLPGKVDKNTGLRY